MTQPARSSHFASFLLRLAIFMAASWMATLLSGCNDEAPAEREDPPPPEVGVLTLEPRPVPNVIEVPGRVQAVRTVEIRARVDGILQRRLYREGSEVEAGAELFAVDPREMEAALRGAQAILEGAQATAANTAQDVARYEGLLARQAISQQDYDAAVARLRTARAEVSRARAEVNAAQLDLEYTLITSPIAGRAGRAQVSEGALVSAANATLLTTVEQSDPVYVNFSQSSSELLAIRHQFASGALDPPDNGRFEVRLTLEDGSRYAETGHLDFFAMTIDQATGTVALRAEFPNPEHLLLPGQFVNAEIDAGTRPDGLVIPQRAVMMTKQGPTAMVVNADDVVTVRSIEVDQPADGDWVATAGLSPGDRVIVDGLQKARPGQPVRALPSGEKAGPARPSETRTETETETRIGSP